MVGAPSLQSFDVRFVMAAASVVRGVDVSQHQGSVEWTKVHAAGFEFAIVKCSEGQDFVDPADGPATATNEDRIERLRRRCTEIRKQDMRLGLYHFLRPRTGRTGAVEADFAVRIARAIGWGEPSDLRLTVDVETTDLSPKATHRYLRQFVERIDELTGDKPIIYTFPAFWQMLGNPSTLGCPLWIAHFDADKPAVPQPWHEYAIWQHSDDGEVPGIRGHVDLNRAPADLPLLRRPSAQAAQAAAVSIPPTTPKAGGGRRRKLKDAAAVVASTGSNEALKTLLTLKAKAGRWDERYCLYYGPDPNVEPAVKQYITRAYAAGLVPTSTTSGGHAPGSFHFQKGPNGGGRAADVGLRRELIGTIEGTDLMQRFQRKEFARRAKTKPVELIGPINNLVILGGAPTALAEGNALEDAHDNHVHGAF